MHIDGTEDCPVGCPEWCAWATDKIEGLEEDLFQAVKVAYERGARKWTESNYPEYYKLLEDTRIIFEED